MDVEKWNKELIYELDLIFDNRRNFRCILNNEINVSFIVHLSWKKKKTLFLILFEHNCQINHC